MTESVASVSDEWHEPTCELRFIEKPNGARILQQKFIIETTGDEDEYQWCDVPCVLA